MTIRQNFDEAIAGIRANVLQMGTTTAEMVRMACEATQACDTELAREVVAMDDQVDRQQYQTIIESVVVVARESPVATDLKVLMSTISIVGEVEQVGDTAVKMARRVVKHQVQLPVELKVSLSELSEQSRHLFHAALRLYAEYSDELAVEIMEMDDAVDLRYKSARTRTIELLGHLQTEELLRAIRVFHNLEQVADSAVEIAKSLRMYYGPPRRVG